MLVKDLISRLEYPVDTIAINYKDSSGFEHYAPYDGLEGYPDKLSIPDNIMDSEVLSYWIYFHMHHISPCEIELEYQLNITLDNTI